jgi:exosortase D (VPLPA-CTERM-specific)
MLEQKTSSGTAAISLRLAEIFTYGLILCLTYLSTLRWLILHDWAMEDFNYAYLIPVVVLYLLWDKRHVLAGIPPSPSWNGLALVIPGVLLFWAGELSGEFFSQYISLWLTVAGLCWLHNGWERLKPMLPALLFSITMFPPPSAVYSKLSFNLKLISSMMGVWMMQLWGLSVHREGNVIDLGFTQLQVVDACSGLRYLVPLVVLGILLVFFYRAKPWKKVVVVLSTIPVSITANSLRIAITGILAQYFGIEAAEGFFHDFAGWFIFMFSLSVILLLMWVLKRIGTEEKPGMDAAPAQVGAGNAGSACTGAAPALQEQDTAAPFFRARTGFWQFVAAFSLLAASLALSYGVDFRQKVPIARPLEGIPMEIGPWHGTRSAMEQKFIDSLDLSDYIIADYSDANGREINFYVAYYETQSKGKSIHSPNTCLPGGGWRFLKSEEKTVTLADGVTMPVNRVLMEKDGVRQVSYYWFPQRGRVLTSLVQLKMFTFWDALTRRRTDGALVRLITPVYPDEDADSAERRIYGFTRLIVPVLNEYIPR